VLTTIALVCLAVMIASYALRALEYLIFELAGLTMDIDRIEELIKVLESSHTEELSVRKGDVVVHIRKVGQPSLLLRSL